MDTFADALEAFKSANTWLNDSHLPALAAMAAIAKELDAGNVRGDLLSQWGLSHRALLKAAPAAEPEIDPVEAAIAAARGEQ